LAISTKGNRGIEDVVSNVFGRAKTFTIIDVKEKDVKNVEVIQNPAASFKQGSGPVVVKTLTDLGVDTVISGEFGPGVITLLEHFKVAKVKVKPGTPIAEAIKGFLE